MRPLHRIVADQERGVSRQERVSNPAVGADHEVFESKLPGCCINLIAHDDLGVARRPNAQHSRLGSIDLQGAPCRRSSLDLSDEVGEGTWRVRANGSPGSTKGDSSIARSKASDFDSDGCLSDGRNTHPNVNGTVR